MFERIVVVTRKTRLEELIERFNTRAQVKFFLEHNGGNFGEYDAEHDTYRRALDEVRRLLPQELKIQVVERTIVPTLLFSPADVIVTLGQDGLVANTAKYAVKQPIIAVNPDVRRYDGILLPFSVSSFKTALAQVLMEDYDVQQITLAQAVLNDGQKLLAFNDFFIGVSSHASARYRLTFGRKTEQQSSSGVIVSTGAGSTGWLSSVFNMAEGLSRAFGGAGPAPLRLPWDDPRLVFAVREPFCSKHSSAEVVAGLIDGDCPLVIESHVPAGGVIFSDGIERDNLAFNSGAKVRVSAAAERAKLVVPRAGEKR